MRIGVISDTHGDMAAVKKAANAVGLVDLWLHAGDYSQDACYLNELTGVRVISAKGNCDGQAAAKIDEFLDIGGLMVWLTHGHRYRVKQGLSDLRYWAKQYEAAIVVYGHTHLPELTHDDDVLFFNPGSPLSASGHRSTCGVINIEGNDISAQHIEIMSL